MALKENYRELLIDAVVRVAAREGLDRTTTKLIAAEKGYDDLMASLKKPEPVTDGRKAAVIGGGPRK